jgi:hypothetical protein
MAIPAIRDSLTWVPLKLKLSANGNEIATATGFFFEHREQTFLITNYHVVSGINPETNKILHKDGARPDTIELGVPTATDESSGPRKAVRFVWKKLPLYAVDSDQTPIWTEPIWHEHPQFGREFDVVAIPLSGLDSTLLRTANAPEHDLGSFRVYPSMDAFVVGYPRGMTGRGNLPIWKRATIATEPDFDHNKKPQFLIDTATREGMSGAPVYAQEVGYILPEDSTDPQDAQIGKSRRFVGVYSGRIGAEDEFKAQLGIVWKESELVSLIEAIPPDTESPP